MNLRVALITSVKCWEHAICTSWVSLPSRETSSPVFLLSKKPSSCARMCRYRRTRSRATMRSPDIPVMDMLKNVRAFVPACKHKTKVMIPATAWLACAIASEDRDCSASVDPSAWTTTSKALPVRSGITSPIPSTAILSTIVTHRSGSSGPASWSILPNEGGGGEDCASAVTSSPLAGSFPSRALIPYPPGPPALLAQISTDYDLNNVPGKLSVNVGLT